MFARLLRQQTGSAAAEMALVAPLLIIIMFASMEMGHYFYSEHVVVKAVRDGARFASRQSFADYACPGGTIGGTVVLDTQRLTRTNTVDGSGSPRLGGWTTDASVSVTATCFDNSSGTYSSFYEGTGEFPIVTVSATVPYSSLFSMVGFNSTGLQLNATQQAVVMGI